MNIYWCFPYPLLLSFHLQIAYRKVRNLQIGVDKLVGKVLINLLHHEKSVVLSMFTSKALEAACIISIIIDVLYPYLVS